MRIVLTREAGRNAAQRAWLPASATVHEVPLTSTREAPTEVVAAALAAHEDVRWLVVTSARAVPYVALARTRWPDARLASVGAPTSAALAGAGMTVDLEGVGPLTSLADALVEGPVLVLGARDGQDELIDVLARRGVAASRVGCYETVPVVLSDEARERVRAADVLLIGAPSAWAVVRDVVRASTLVVVPGPTTAAAVAATHAHLVEGWDESLRERLEAIAS